MAASMIERVARALAAADNGVPTTWKLYADEARAAIAAMRKQSVAMEEAGLDATGGSASCLASYRAMIDAALADG